MPCIILGLFSDFRITYGLGKSVMDVLTRKHLRLLLECGVFRIRCTVSGSVVDGVASIESSTIHIYSCMHAQSRNAMFPMVPRLVSLCSVLRDGDDVQGGRSDCVTSPVVVYQLKGGCVVAAVELVSECAVKSYEGIYAVQSSSKCRFLIGCNSPL